MPCTWRCMHYHVNACHVMATGKWQLIVTNKETQRTRFCVDGNSSSGDTSIERLVFGWRRYVHNIIPSICLHMHLRHIHISYCTVEVLPSIAYPLVHKTLFLADWRDIGLLMHALWISVASLLLLLSLWTSRCNPQCATEWMNPDLAWVTSFNGSADNSSTP